MTRNKILPMTTGGMQVMQPCLPLATHLLKDNNYGFQNAGTATSSTKIIDRENGRVVKTPRVKYYMTVPKGW